MHTFLKLNYNITADQDSIPDQPFVYYGWFEYYETYPFLRLNLSSCFSHSAIENSGEG